MKYDVYKEGSKDDEEMDKKMQSAMDKEEKKKSAIKQAKMKLMGKSC